MLERTVDGVIGLTPKQRGAVAGCARGWLRRRGHMSMVPGRHPRTVRVIARQWWTILEDSRLTSNLLRLETAVAAIVEAAASPVVSDVGRRVFVALDQVVDACRVVAAMFNVVGWFAPPEHLAGMAAVLDRMEEVMYGFARDAVDAAVEGLPEQRWHEVLSYTATRDALIDELRSVAARMPEVQEPLLETVLGLPGSVIDAGDGLTFAARVSAAWARQSDVLDDRLRETLPHLLDPSMPLMSEVRLHLTGLLLREYPWRAHVAAVAARDLVLAALATDADRCLDVITESVERQNQMYFTHTRISKAVAAVKAARYPEEAADPAANIYLAMAEGDVRRAAVTVLTLLGEDVPDKATLHPLRTRLAAHRDSMACAVLLWCIDTHLRNAIAHSHMEWDAEHQCMVLDGRAVSPHDLMRMTLQAYGTCTGLHAGISVALNQAGNPHHHRPPPTDPSVWDGRLLDILGSHGIEATRARRQGRTIHIQVPHVTAATLRDHLVGVYHADQIVPHVDDWILAPHDRPDLLLDAATLATARSLTEPDHGDSPSAHVYAIEPVLYAGALFNHGLAPDRIVRSVIGLASSQAVGERNRLLPQWSSEPAAVAELTSALRHLARGVVAAASLLPESVRDHLDGFAAMLTARCERLGAVHLEQEAREASIQLDWALRSNTPIEIPWRQEAPAPQ
ncbi:hypothetical protein LZG04_11380 [Saccharothrix sp. S26]|uniref:hypothetical protein n=1 Tax=Saccharothrix sp. S26 TaxID=2907215 RepID=UPI001F2AE434|nr:hypothetical protein [Saccharothrix sp. S26]MCE6995405.1 hypothetical protein [Saccharothrix sp. S26]